MGKGQSWDKALAYLTKKFPELSQSGPGAPLSMPFNDEEWFLEITPQGKLICQAGYALDDMKSLLSDGTPEDLGTDELAKQTKFYLQQTISKHRNRLLQEGFEERLEMNDEYVAVFFERKVDLEDLPSLETAINQYRSQFSLS